MMSPPTGASQPDPSVHRSLGFHALVRELQADQKIKILDLGPASGSNLEFWSRYPCTLHLEDFASSLPLESPVEEEEDSEAYDRLLEGLVTVDRDVRFDVILCWDIFNYLDQPLLAAFVRLLSRFCLPGTLLFALVSSAQEIPAKPIRFKIVDPEHLRYEAQTEGTIPCPRYQPREISKILGGFEISNSFLLRNGVQEYLFRFPG